MEPDIASRLSAVRNERGIPAARLARLAGLSRQTLYAIEAGTYLPNTAVALRLARALEVRVEDLFSLQTPASGGPRRTAQAVLLPGGDVPRAGQPVELCRVGRRTLASAPFPLPWSLPPADAVVLSSDAARAGVQFFRDDEDLGGRLLVAGCDPGISVLARHLQRAGITLVVAHRNSSEALALLRQGLIHVAGTHLRDEASGESNLPAVRRLFPRDAAAVISFAVWEEGLLVARGNPKSIRGIEDLARSDVSVVNREPGAGSRILLDAHLERLGIATARVRGYERIAPGHLPAAWQVRADQADCCLATGAAARLFGLDILPLVTERYDLVVRRRQLRDRAVETLIDTLNRAAFRRELEGVGGYDAGDAGRRLL